MDWTAPGTGNRFEYELVDPFDLDVSWGWLDNVTGGRITESYRGDYRSTASIDLDGEQPPSNALVRVWHVASAGGEELREEIGTFAQGAPSLSYRNGRLVGSVALHSAMWRLAQDVRPASATYAAGTNVAAHFEQAVSEAGCTPWLHPSLDASKGFPSEHVWKGGESVLSECHACADALGGMVQVDAHGRVAIEPYQLPSARADSFSIDPSTAVIERGGVSVTAAEWFNCVAVTATVEEAEYVGVAKVGESHPLHMRRVGYWKTDYRTMTDPPEEGVQDAVDAEAASALAQVSSAPAVYSADMLYRPVRCGEVGTFWYADSPDDAGLFVRGLLTQREIDLDAAMRMRATFEEVS